jgi:hypothetical protein
MRAKTPRRGSLPSANEWRQVALLIALLSGLGTFRASAADNAPSIEALGFLAGTWTGDDAGLQVEETWLAPKGGALIGMHRDVAKGRMVSFEFLRIEANAEGKVAYWASPRSRPPVPFWLKEAADKRVVFENLEHDFPQRILYWLDPEGRLHARVEGSAGSREKAQEWVWTKAAR